LGGALGKEHQRAGEQEHDEESEADAQQRLSFVPQNAAEQRERRIDAQELQRPEDA
jgi:hypothetical protein